MQEVLPKNKKMKSIAVIDHWVNYAQRFKRNNSEPQGIWVADEEAAILARQQFPDSMGTTTGEQMDDSVKKK